MKKMMLILFSAFSLIPRASFAGTSDEDPIVWRLRKDFAAYLTPKTERLKIGTSYNCVEVSASKGHFRRDIYSNLLNFQIVGNLVLNHGRGAVKTYVITETTMTGTDTNGNLEYIRQTPAGDLVIERTARTGTNSTYETAISNPDKFAANYYVCPAADFPVATE